MASRHAVIALLLVQLIALAVSAQQPAEFGRATGGELVMTTKNAARLSGSLQLSLSSGNDVFGRGSTPGYGLTAGGTLLKDRLWFFGSASRSTSVSSSRFANLELPENATTGAIAARANGQLAASHDFSAFFETARRPELSTAGTATFANVVPSSFLALRYDGLVSSNMSFSTSFTRSSRRGQGWGFGVVE
jgi:hypothetical protein